MLRAGKVVQPGPLRPFGAQLAVPFGARHVSVQLVRKLSPKVQRQIDIRKQQLAQGGGNSGSDGANPAQRVHVKPGKNKYKFHKLASRLADLKRAESALEKPVQESSPVTAEQRQLLDLIQGPLLSAQDFRATQRNFLRREPRQFVERDADEPERARYDAVLDRHLAISRLQSVKDMEDAQKEFPAAELVAESVGELATTREVAPPASLELTKSIMGYFRDRMKHQQEKRGKVPGYKPPRMPWLQQINFEARMEVYRARLMTLLIEEAEARVEQQQTHVRQLEELKSACANGEMSSEQLEEYEQLSKASEGDKVLNVLTELGLDMVVNSSLFWAAVAPRIATRELTDGSDFVHLINLTQPSVKTRKVRLQRFESRHKLFRPAEDGQRPVYPAVADGRRVFVKFGKDIVAMPSYSLSAHQLGEILKSSVLSEFERVRKQYSIEEDDLVAQLGVITDRGDSYMDIYPPKPSEEVDEITGLPVAPYTEPEDMAFSFFKIHENEKERYYSTKQAVRQALGSDTGKQPIEAYDVDHLDYKLSQKDEVLPATQRASYEDVVAAIEQMRPGSMLVSRKHWKIEQFKLDNTFLKSDLQRYVKEWCAANGEKSPANLSAMPKDQLIEVIRETVWGITLTTTVEGNTYSKGFRLSDTQKLFLFKYHYSLVQLWVSRGAEISFKGDTGKNDIYVTAGEEIMAMVSITLSQFGSRLTRAPLGLSAAEVAQLPQELLGRLQESTLTLLEPQEDGTLEVVYLGDAAKKAVHLNRYLRMLQQPQRFSQSVIYQTNPEAVEKSAFFPRAVAHEQPWHKRAVRTWSRWREIHGSEYLVNAERPELSLVTSEGVQQLSTDQPLQTLIASALRDRLDALPAQTIEQDAEHTVEPESERDQDDPLTHEAIAAGIVAPYDPSANNTTTSNYEKIAVSASLGHLVHAGKTTRGSKGSLDVSALDPVKDVHFSGSVPFLNEKLRSMFPKPRPTAQERFKIVLHCEPVGGPGSQNCPPIEIEAVSMTKKENLYKYPPPSVYAVTRHANLLVSLPSTNSDMLYSARSRQKILPTADLLQAWRKYARGINRGDNVEHAPVFEVNINHENVLYQCVNVVYTRHDEYPVASFDKTDPLSSGGTVIHRNTAGGDISGVQNYVSVDTTYREYNSEAANEPSGPEQQLEGQIPTSAADSGPTSNQQLSNALLEDFVGNSLKFMDSLDAEAVPL